MLSISTLISGINFIPMNRYKLTARRVLRAQPRPTCSSRTYQFYDDDVTTSRLSSAFNTGRFRLHNYSVTLPQNTRPFSHDKQSIPYQQQDGEDKGDFLTAYDSFGFGLTLVEKRVQEVSKTMNENKTNLEAIKSGLEGMSDRWEREMERMARQIKACSSCFSNNGLRLKQRNKSIKQLWKDLSQVKEKAGGINDTVGLLEHEFFDGKLSS